MLEQRYINVTIITEELFHKVCVVVVQALPKDDKTQRMGWICWAQNSTMKEPKN